MIILEDGSKEVLPYVKIEIEPGRWPFQWWYEVHTWNAKTGWWEHDYMYDGGGFGLWRVWKKAKIALMDAWDREYAALNK